MQEYLHLNILIKNLNFIYVVYIICALFTTTLDNISFSVTRSVSKMLGLCYFVLHYAILCCTQNIKTSCKVAVVDEHNAVNSGSVEMDVLSVYSGTSSSHAA